MCDHSTTVTGTILTGLGHAGVATFEANLRGRSPAAKQTSRDEYEMAFEHKGRWDETGVSE